MRILGVDPGLATTGWGVIEDSDRLEMVDCGFVSTRSKDPTSERLLKIFDELERVIYRYKPRVLAVEELFFSKNAVSVFALGQARGAIILLACKKGLEIFEYNPRTVKIALTGFGGAEKNQIQDMVARILGLKTIPKPDDVADALAIAICHINSKTVAERIKYLR